MSRFRVCFPGQNHKWCSRYHTGGYMPSVCPSWWCSFWSLGEGIIQFLQCAISFPLEINKHSVGWHFKTMQISCFSSKYSSRLLIDWFIINMDLKIPIFQCFMFHCCPELFSCSIFFFFLSDLARESPLKLFLGHPTPPDFQY